MKNGTEYGNSDLTIDIVSSRYLKLLQAWRIGLEERTGLALALFVPVLVDAFPVIPFHLDTELLLHLGYGVLHGYESASVAASRSAYLTEIDET